MLISSAAPCAGPRATYDVVEGNSLSARPEQFAFGDAGYQGVDKRADANPDVTWHIAMRLASAAALDKDHPADALIDQAEKACWQESAPYRAPVSGHQASLDQMRYRADSQVAGDAVLRCPI